ncbi:MAG: hypothetical protein U5O39_18965 [Gammaproteobacteria bacterium]|nr:hypothetical protein [Gammaproteobacteria bacterium]
MIDDANDLTLGSVAAGGTFAVDLVSGSLTGAQTINVTGATTLDAGGTSTTANDISLTGPANDFSSVIITGGGDVTLVDNNAITLNTANVGGTYSVTAGTSLTIAGAVSAADASFDASGGAGQLTDTGTGSVNVSGATTLAGETTDDIVLDAANNEIATLAVMKWRQRDDRRQQRGSGPQRVDDLGRCRYNDQRHNHPGGALSVGGTSTFDSGDNDITLSHEDNIFTGGVTFTGLTSASNLEVFDETALALQSGLSVNNLTVTADGITQSGPDHSGRDWQP